MPSVTEHYKISGPVPFVDVDVAADNRRYIDPRRIRLSRSPEPFASRALDAIDTFFDEITDCVVSTSSADRARGETLLQRFHEPQETRLGMSQFGFAGHGGSAGIGSQIWTALDGDLRALIEVGVFKQLDYMPVCVDDVDADITSDVVTRIIYRPLVEFTNQVVHDFSEFTTADHTTEAVTRQVWEPSGLTWKDEVVTLPVAGGNPLLLVPRDWVGGSLLVNARRFHGTSLLSSVQRQRAVVIDGRPVKTPKDQLREDPSLRCERTTIVREVLAAYRERGEDVFAEFDRFVDAQLERHRAA